MSAAFTFTGTLMFVLAWLCDKPREEWGWGVFLVLMLVLASYRAVVVHR